MSEVENQIEDATIVVEEGTVNAEGQPVKVIDGEVTDGNENAKQAEVPADGATTEAAEAPAEEA